MGPLLYALGDLDSHKRHNFGSERSVRAATFRDAPSMCGLSVALPSPDLPYLRS